MSISSSSVIHYTKNIGNIKRILNEGFKPTYCYEKVHYQRQYIHGAFPMVSFCDLPLSEVKKHLDSYGFYGIGLKKEWAKSNHMNPVLYFDTDAEILRFLRDEFKEKVDALADEEGDLSHLDVYTNILSYSKNYEANLTRKGKTIVNYRFYNEREWRYVPTKTELGAAPALLDNETFKGNKKIHNEKLNHIRLKFEAKDISYVIVKGESDIQTVTGILRNRYEDTLTSKELEIMLTKIITAEQILQDF